MCDIIIPDWPTDSPNWDEDCISLLRDGITSPEENSNIDNLINLSNKFPIKFPIESARCKTLLSSVNKDILQRNIDSAYPVILESALYLYAKFLLFKRKYGTNIEKELYKNMSIVGLVDRLLTKRAVMFMGKYDSYILIDNKKGAGKWDTIGKNNEKSPLILKNCISYDEIKLSVFLSVSSYSYFINDGSRKNKGVIAKSRSSLEPEGIIIGLIGARLKRIKAMEYEEMVITKTQNTSQNGYGEKNNSLHSLFADFYEEPCFTFNDAVQKSESDRFGRFYKLNEQDLFDNVVYAKRLALSFDTLLLEANSRAEEAKKTAYVHLVGIGLGVWKASEHQSDVFVGTFMKRLSILGTKLSNVSDVDFAYFGGGITNKDFKEGHQIKIKDHPKKGITIHVSKRQPHIKVESGKLLVVSYAWDGNALPGNEYWKGMLGSTGDSAAAASTQITELHNPYINHRVCAANLRVATEDGLITLEHYVAKLQGGGDQGRCKAGSKSGAERTRNLCTDPDVDDAPPPAKKFKS